MDTGQLTATVQAFWEQEALPALVEYIRIPNKSPAFDPDWAANGYMEQATRLYAATAERLLAATRGATVEVFRLEGRTPVILIDAPATARDADAQARDVISWRGLRHACKDDEGERVAGHSSQVTLAEALTLVFTRTRREHRRVRSVGQRHGKRHAGRNIT